MIDCLPGGVHQSTNCLHLLPKTTPNLQGRPARHLPRTLVQEIHLRLDMFASLHTLNTVETFAHMHGFKLTSQMTNANAKMCRRRPLMLDSELKKPSVTVSVQSLKLKELAASGKEIHQGRPIIVGSLFGLGLLMLNKRSLQ